MFGLFVLQIAASNKMEKVFFYSLSLSHSLFDYSLSFRRDFWEKVIIIFDFVAHHPIVSSNLIFILKLERRQALKTHCCVYKCYFIL